MFKRTDTLLHGLFSHVLDAHFHAGKVVRLISWLCFYLAPTILLLVLKPAKGKVPDEKKQIATIGLVNLSIGWLAPGWLAAFVCSLIVIRKMRTRNLLEMQSFSAS